MAYHGRYIYIKYGGTKIGGIQSKSIVVTNEPVDASSDDDDTWRQLEGDTGARYLTITGTGVFLNDTIAQSFVDAALNGTSRELTVEFENGDTITGTFFCNFTYSGEFNGAVMYSVTMETNLIDAVDPSLTRYSEPVTPLPTVWTERSATLKGVSSGDVFGFDTGLSNDGALLIIGAIDKDYISVNAGIAYVYSWNGTSWSLQDTLHQLSPSVGDVFGSSVAISSDGLVAAVGENRPPSTPGIVFLFDRSGSTWTRRSSTISSGGDYFGNSVALSSDGSVLVVGDPFESGLYTNAGQVHVYDWDGASWSLRGSFNASDASANQYFGFSAISSDGLVLAVGASGGNKVYIYDKSGSSWTERGVISGTAGQSFGRSVALNSDGSVLSVGAWTYNTNTGRVYTYDWDGSVWTQRNSTDGSGSVSGDYFGAVSLSGNGLVMAVGAAYTDSIGVDAGEVYLYDAE